MVSDLFGVFGLVTSTANLIDIDSEVHNGLNWRTYNEMAFEMIVI